ncbi:MAG: tetratricopeptide repeat protein, partial [Proteobacteria bacterium]|nr:tetratricopeptide repeat protein [Pseudomonadota bacterium]
MMLKDRYGNELSTSSTAARDAYVRGVDSLMAATPGTDAAFAEAVAADEGFALGHISLARAKQLMGRGHEAKAPRARALELAAGTTPREQSHIAIFDKILSGQGDAALAAIKDHLRSWPRDAMAFAPATSVFGLIGFSGRVGREKEQLAMIEPFEKDYGDDWWYRTQLAFAQIELGQFGVGEHNIERALAAYPKSAHAAHIRGHLFYEVGEREQGLAFITDWMKDYARDGLMHCHNSWHMAVWSLETGRSADAWRIYDESLRPGASWGPQVNVATDCPAFL